MFAINHVVVSGNLTRDPQPRATQSGNAVCNFTVAHNKRVKNGDRWEDQPHFFDCTAFGSMAEAAAKMRKGERIVVGGELTLTRWTGKDGQPRSKVEITARDIVSAPRSQATPQAQGSNYGEDVYDEGVPF